VFTPSDAHAYTPAPTHEHPLCRLQVKVQTVPGYARGMADGLPKFVQQEGVGGLFKGLTPLWGRQIPYTMMKFGEPPARCAAVRLWGRRASRGRLGKGGCPSIHASWQACLFHAAQGGHK
jgi:hypothetical protein